MSKPTERNLGPVTVPFAATPTGEPSSIVDWANRSVWTDRMLTTLEQGVRGGRWHTLIDKVYAPLNLFVASSHVLDKNGAAGVVHLLSTLSRFSLPHLGQLDSWSVTQYSS